MAGSRAGAERRIEAFRALYRRHYGFVWQTMQRFGVLPALVDDAVQDTFVVAFRRLDDLVPAAATRWLYGIARRIASNYRRAQRRVARKQRVLTEQTSTAARSTAPQDAVLELDAFLAALTPIDRELFVLTQLEGMTGPESAELLALNPSTAYDRIGRLRRRFCEHLGERAPRDVLLAARRKRPNASARGWAVLLPRLGTSWLARWATLAAWPKLAWIGAPIVAVALLGARPPDKPSPAIARASSSPDRGAEEAEAQASTVRPDPAPAPATLPVPPTTTIAPQRAVAPAVSTRRRPQVEHTPEAAREPVAAPAGESSLARHNRLLRAAVDDLRAGRVAASLAGITQHQNEFSDSPLADARTALHVEALCASGRPDAARARATELLRADPRSPVRGRIERSCAGASVDPRAAGQEEDR